MILKEHEGARKPANLDLKYSNVISDFLNHVLPLELCTHAGFRLQNVEYFQEEGVP